MIEEPQPKSRLAKAKSYSFLGITLLFGVAMILAAMAIVAPPFSIFGEDADDKSAGTPGGPAVAVAEVSTEAERDESAAQEARERLEGTAGDEELLDDPGYTYVEGFTVLHDGTPVAGASVKAVRIRSLDQALCPDKYETFRTQSAGDGWFAFEDIPPGTYSLVALQDGLSGHDQAFVARKSDHPTGFRGKLELMLKPTGRISGRVKGLDGQPIQGAYIIPYSMPALFETSGEDGRFECTNLQTGVYSFKLYAEGMAHTTIRDVATGTSDLEIVMLAGGTASGTVTLDGKPAPGVTIRAFQSDNYLYGSLYSRTDAQGRYTLNGLNDIRYYVEAYTDRCATMARQIMVVEGEHLDGIDFELKPCGALAGKVVRKADGQPLQGMWVWAFQERYRYGESLFSRTHCCTDQEGRFRIASLARGDYYLGVKGTGSYKQCLWNNGKKIDLMPGDSKEDLLFELEPGAVVDVQVRAKSGEPIPNAYVNLYDADHFKWYRSYYRHGQQQAIPKFQNLGAGAYRMEGLATGVYHVNAYRSGWKYARETLAVENSADRLSMEIELEPGFDLSGRVVDSKRKGVAGACVSVSQQSAVTDEEGRFTVTGITRDRGSINVYAEGFMTYQHYFKNLRADMEELDIVLLPKESHYLAGKVVNDLEAPITGVKITLSQRADKNVCNQELYSDENGCFRAEGLSECEVTLSVGTGWGRPREKQIQGTVDRSDNEIVIERFATVQGRVLDENNDPIDEFSVYSYTKDVRHSRVAEPFESGSYRLAKVLPGKVKIYASTLDDRRGSSDYFDLAPGMTMDQIDLTLTEVGSLSGKVCDAYTLEPIADASVFVYSTTDDDFQIEPWTDPAAITGADGTFLIEGLKPGPINLAASHTDYREIKDVAQTVVARESIEGIQILLSQGAELFGTVLVDGVGKPGVEIWINEKARSGFEGQTVTGKEGAFCFKSLTPGSYSVSASLREENNCWSSLSKVVEVGLGGYGRCDFQFKPGATLQGVVTLMNKPQAGVYVSAYPDRDDNNPYQEYSSSRSSFYTDENGAYCFTRLTPGNYRLYANSRGGHNQYRFSQNVYLSGGLNIFDIVLGQESTAGVYGYITQNGLPVPECNINLSVDQVRANTRSDANGYYSLNNLPSGRTNINVNSQDRETKRYINLSKPLELIAGGSIRVDLDLPHGSAVLCGKVFSNGEPLNRSKIHLRKTADRNGGSLYLSVSSQDGRYRVEGLVPGYYEVSCSGPRYLRQNVQIISNRTTRLDFIYTTGKAVLKGKIKRPADLNEKAETVWFYLFIAGACPWKEGQSLSPVSSSQGLMAGFSITRKDDFKLEKLPPGPVDAVALRRETKGDQKILELEIIRIHLFEGSDNRIAMDVSGMKDE